MQTLSVATWRIPKAPMEDVERASALTGHEAALARYLRETHGVQEFVYAATCQRVLVAYVAPPGAPTPDALLHAALAAVRPDVATPATAPEAFTGFAAYEHLAEVTASLDSLVPGEAQILGQMKAAFQASEERGHVGKLLRRTFSLIFKAAKRVRSDTDLFRGKVSLIPLTVELLEARMSGIPRPEVALVGTGTIGLRMLDLLRDYPTASLHLVSRVQDRATEAGSPYNARGHALATFLEKPPALDVLILSARAEEPLFTAAIAERFAAARSGPRPLLVIDLAMPRNAHEDVRGVEGIALVQLDELATISERNRADRERELAAARALLLEEMEGLRRALEAEKEKPTILDLRAAMDAAAAERLAQAREMFAAAGVDVDGPEFQRWYQQAVKHFTHVAMRHARKQLREAPAEERDAA